jgi:hypothetical protein
MKKIEIEIEIPKKMSRNEKIFWFQSIIINKQLEYFNLNWDEFKIIQESNKNWENEYKLTKEQYNEIETFALILLNKLFKWNKLVCKKEWGWFSLNNTLPVDFQL